MTELLKLKRFWVAVAGVVAIALNHFFGFSESQTLDLLVAVISAGLGTSAGLTAGQNRGPAMRLIRLVLEAVLILLRWYCDPERMKQEMNERLERERQERVQEFRKAVDQKNADGVSGMLARLRDRLRRKNGLPGGR